MEIGCVTGGCGAKLGPGALRGVLDTLDAPRDAKLMVGFDASDDAAVYRINDELAIISTADFFPPMTDDPFLFGQIAAANALSDVYAMGGTPILALNLVCFPADLDRGIMQAILKGGADVLREAGVSLGGGHSISDDGIKYGLAVTGTVNPNQVLRNNTCKEGDVLILTKPLGIGLALSASRSGVAAQAVKDGAFSTMRRLNKYAAEKLRDYPVSACTDVTGFGLAVHASEMAGSEHTLHIDSGALPMLPGILDYIHLATAAGERNRGFLGDAVVFSGVSPGLRELVFDPQTSGGLLISVPDRYSEELCAKIKRDDSGARIIGRVQKRGTEPLVVY